MLWQLILGVALLFLGLLKLIAAGIFFSFFIIFLGIQFLFGFAVWPFGNNQCNTNANSCMQSTWLGHSQYSLDAATFSSKQLIEYKTIAGTSELDFSSVASLQEKPRSPVIVNIDTVLGKTVLHISKIVPTRIFTKAALGITTLPDTTSSFIGTSIYSNLPQEQPWMIINCSTVCGSIEIRTT